MLHTVVVTTNYPLFWQQRVWIHCATEDPPNQGKDQQICRLCKSYSTTMHLCVLTSNQNTCPPGGDWLILQQTITRQKQSIPNIMKLIKVKTAKYNTCWQCVLSEVGETLIRQSNNTILYEAANSASFNLMLFMSAHRGSSKRLRFQSISEILLMLHHRCWSN